MQEVSRVCKIAANIHILKTTLFPRFQDIRLGCCTVAAHRALSVSVAIGALNLLLKWTFIGWVAALVWAFTTVQRQRVD